MDDYDSTLFVIPEFQTLYYADLGKRKLLPKQGIFLEKVPEKLLTFYDRLVTIEWR